MSFVVPLDMPMRCSDCPIEHYDDYLHDFECPIVPNDSRYTTNTRIFSRLPGCPLFGGVIYSVDYDRSACDACESYYPGYYDDSSECEKGYQVFPFFPEDKVCPNHKAIIRAQELDIPAYNLLGTSYFRTIQEADAAIAAAEKGGREA